MAVNIGPKIGIDGEAEFRKQISQINTNLKTLDSEMKVVTSSFAGQEKSVESLTAENEVLTKQLGKLNERLDKQKEMLEACKAQYGETDERTLKWQQTVNNTQAEINKATQKINDNSKAMDSLGNETDDTGKALDDAGKNALTFGDILKANVLSEAIIGGVKALGSAIKDVASGMVDLVKDSAKSADEINTLSKQTGLSTDTIQKFQYAADVIDVPLDTLTGSLSKLTKTMSTAKSGSGAAADAFKQLGISVTDDNGALRDNEEVFKEIIAALGEIDNETERDATAMTLLGKSAQDLNPLILGGADALEELGQKAEEAGLILSSSELNDLNSVQDAFDEMTATLQKAGMSIVSTFAEPLSEALNTLVGYVQRLTKAFKEGGWEAMAGELGSIVEEIVKFLTDNIDKIGKFAEDVLTKFIDIFVENLPKLIPAAVSLLVTLGTALIDHLDELIDAAFQIVSSLAEEILKPDNLTKIINAGVKLLVALVSNTVEIIAGLIAALPEIIMGLVNGLTDPENLAKMAEAGKELMNAVWSGIKSIASTVGRWVSEWVSSTFGGGGSGSIMDSFNDLVTSQGYHIDYSTGSLVQTPTYGYAADDIGQGIVGNAKGGTTINLVTPDAEVFATYTTPAINNQSRVNGTPFYDSALGGYVNY